MPQRGDASGTSRGGSIVGSNAPRHDQPGHPATSAAQGYHVKHMGFELELAHDRIVRVLHNSRVKEDDILTVIEHLKPVNLARAVADTMLRVDGVGRGR